MPFDRPVDPPHGSSRTQQQHPTRNRPDDQADHYRVEGANRFAFKTWRKGSRYPAGISGHIENMTRPSSRVVANDMIAF
jgi:hypothetical protein